MKLLKIIGNRLLQILIAFDQLCNACTPNGWADETLSSRAHRLSEKGNKTPKKFINLIFFLQKDHCKEAYESERFRYHLPPEFRGKGVNLEDNMVEIEKLDTIPSTWIIRLNGDGNTFDAVCTVVHKTDSLLEIKAALSKLGSGVFVSMLLDIADYFSDLGYKNIIFTHNGKTITRKLKVRK